MEKTIVIQGAIDSSNVSKVQKCIDTARSWFQGKVIVSTWKTENNYKLFNVDKVISSKDPGPGPFNGLYPVQQHCNLIRQINGLKTAIPECEDGLILKIRNDCLLTKNIFDLYDDQDSFGILSIFKKKIMVGNLMTINPNHTSEKNSFFRISDWLYLGYKKDLESLCHIDGIINETDYSQSFLGTEHILAYNLLKYHKFNNLNLNSFKRLIPLAWDYILNNFQVKNTISSCGIKNIGKWEHQPEDLPCYLTESVYNEALNHYVNNFS
jgi:hypothetical protein